MTGSEMGNSTGNAQFLQVPQASASTSGTSRLIPQNEPVQSPQQSPQTSSRRSSKVCKVLSLFDLISSPSPSMKIQIMGGKITENLGFESLLWKVKNYFVLFLIIFKFSVKKNCISLFLTIFEYLVLQIRDQ